MKGSAIFSSIVASLLFTISCKAQQSNNRQERREPPSIGEIFKQMDENEDGQLSKEEVKGPLKDMFSEIDVNEDGFLSKEEIEKAPKPERPKRQ